MQRFSEFIAEASNHEELSKRIMTHMRKTYDNVAYDLPSPGNHHFDAAHDHVRMVAYDEFHKHANYSPKHHNLDKLSKKALAGIEDDRAESRAKDRKRDKVYNDNWVKNTQPKTPTTAFLKRHLKKLNAPSKNPKRTPGTRRGIGSY